MKNIGVFLSASDVPQKYIAPAKKFVRLLAKNKFNMVWGGSDKGLMKVVADEVQKNGGKLISITMPLVQKSVKKNRRCIVSRGVYSEKIGRVYPFCRDAGASF